MSWEDKDPNCEFECVLISMVGPEMPQRASKNGVKVRGVGTEEQCRQRAKYLHEYDTENSAPIDTYIVKMGHWVPMSLTTRQARDAGIDVKFQENELNEFFAELQRNKEKYERNAERRKQAVAAGRIPLNELKGELELMEKDYASLKDRIDDLRNQIETKEEEEKEKVEETPQEE